MDLVLLGEGEVGEMPGNCPGADRRGPEGADIRAGSGDDQVMAQPVRVRHRHRVAAGRLCPLLPQVARRGP